MARQERQVEGDNAERRKRAREARKQGKSPSAAGVTLGASKQRETTNRKASHQERLETPQRGKRSAATSGKPRPGNRDTDPERTNRWE
jgi:hypothetical protein